MLLGHLEQGKSVVHFIIFYQSMHYILLNAFGLKIDQRSLPDNAHDDGIRHSGHRKFSHNAEFFTFYSKDE